MAVRKRQWFAPSDLTKIEAGARELAAADGDETKWRSLRYTIPAGAKLDIKPNERWIAEYVDADGHRCIDTFNTKTEARDYQATVHVDVRKGTHTSPSKSITVEQAAADWITACEGEKLERATIDQYKQHAKHINARIGKERLARLTTPGIEKLKDSLLVPQQEHKKMSRKLAKKVLTSLKSILKDAKRRGNVAQNVASGVSIKFNKRHGKKLEVGVDIPTPEEVRKIIAASAGKWRAVLVVAVFSGLRASEIRGLRWKDIDFGKGDKGKLYVRQRADRYLKIGSPKTESGSRMIPIGPFVLNTLREWKLQSAPGGDGEAIVFRTKNGRIYHHKNLQRGIDPVLKRAGVVNKDGGPKYAFHAFRHFFASFCINSKKDGGLELDPKRVQERMGHSNLAVTMDVYGHLFIEKGDGAELAAAERALVG